MYVWHLYGPCLMQLQYGCTSEAAQVPTDWGHMTFNSETSLSISRELET